MKYTDIQEGDSLEILKNGHDGDTYYAKGEIWRADQDYSPNSIHINVSRLGKKGQLCVKKGKVYGIEAKLVGTSKEPEIINNYEIY